MTTTATITPNPLDTPADTPPHTPADAPLEPPPVSRLPITAGDAHPDEHVRREHAWPVSWFIFLANLIALGLGVGAVACAGTSLVNLVQGDFGFAGTTALLAVGMALGSVVQRTLAKNVAAFSSWGWWGAMAELSIATLSKVAAVVADPGSFPGAVFGIVIDLLWMRHFWERRGDFDVDLDF